MIVQKRVFKLIYIFSIPMNGTFFKKKGAVYSPYNLSTTIVDLFPGKGLPSLEKIALEALEKRTLMTKPVPP